MKTKLTFSELSEIGDLSPVSYDDQKGYFGGGNGSGSSSAYSLTEYTEMGFNITNGLVQFPSDDVCYPTGNNNDYCGVCECSGPGYTGSSDYSGSSNYPGFSFSYNPSNYSGGSAYSYFEAYSIICNLVDELPSCVHDRLSEVTIEYNSENKKPGSYSDNSDTITLKNLDYDTLYGECIHATQDQENLGGDNHVAREYQEHIIGDFARYIRGLDQMHGHDIDEHASIDVGVAFTSRTVQGSDNSTSWAFSEWLEECIDKKTKEINMSVFLSKVKEFEQAFQNSHPDEKGYQGNIPSDYNYDWEQMFRKMGFKVK